MGRLLKRVPIDFEWEINKVWCGYVNPHKVHICNECNGNGYSKDYNRLNDEWYGYNKKDNYIPNPFRKDCIYNSNAWNNNITDDDVKALIDADRLWDFTRIPLNDEQKEIVKQRIDSGKNSWLPFNNGYIPTAKEVNEWNLKGMGHDSINAYYCIKARLKKNGKSHLCEKCKGTGENWQHPKSKRLYKNWKPYDPPTGEGFQLWEDTSEGSPKSPVFNSLEKLCEWCELNATTFGHQKTTKENWYNMLTENFVINKEGNIIFI